MARVFRLWEKKRGDRRTGSRLAGSLGEAAFFGSLFMLAVIALATLLTNQWMTPHPQFLEVGFGTWLILLVLTSLILISGAGFILTVLEMRASAERRWTLVRRAAALDLIRQPREQAAPVHPTIPRDANLINSPGVQLAYRLPSLESPAWRLVAAAATALTCLGIATVLTVIAVAGFSEGQPQYALTAFLIPFSSVTAWSMYYLARQLLLHAGIGPTSVEISAHPLRPGQTLEVYLVQSGRMNATRLAMSLVCEEEAAFRQGTDIRTERREVYRREIFCREDFKIDPAMPFEHHTSFVVPEGAMHSFQSLHNAIHWKLEVRGEFAKWPTMIRNYPLIIYPPEPTSLATHDGTAD